MVAGAVMVRRMFAVMCAIKAGATLSNFKVSKPRRRAKRNGIIIPTSPAAPHVATWYKAKNTLERISPIGLDRYNAKVGRSAPLKKSSSTIGAMRATKKNAMGVAMVKTMAAGWAAAPARRDMATKTPMMAPMPMLSHDLSGSPKSMKSKGISGTAAFTMKNMNVKIRKTV